MTMHQPLVPCPVCRRHVRATEHACPFCAQSLPTDLARRAIPGLTQRLGRGAAFVFASSLAVVGCGGKSETPPTTTSDAASAGDTKTGVDTGAIDTGNVAPPYGIPADTGGPPDDGGSSADYGAPPVDGGGGGAEYGAPPPPKDAG